MLLSFGAKTENLTIVSSHMKDFANNNESGIYLELLKHIYPNNTLLINVSEFSRAKNQFVHNQADIMVGVYKEELPQAYFSTWFLDTDSSIVAFYSSDNGKKSKEKPSFKK